MSKGGDVVAGRSWVLVAALLGICVLGGPLGYSVGRARQGRRPAPSTSRRFTDAEQIADRVMRRWQAAQEHAIRR